MAMCYYCQGCKGIVTAPVGNVKRDGVSVKFSAGRLPVDQQCSTCDGAISVGGPFYGGPIHDKPFVAKLLAHIHSNTSRYKTHTRMIGMTTVIQEELDVPFYYSIPALCSVVKCSAMKHKQFCSALLNAGYGVSATHCKPEAVKTNAPGSVVWDVMRAWAKVQKVVAKDGSVGKVILDRESKIVVDFTIHKDAEAASKKENLVRYQENPTANWGPMSRAGKKVGGDKNGTTKKQKMNSTVEK